MHGKLIGQKENVLDETLAGEDLPTGIYYVEVTDGIKKKVIRVIKE